jgi:hypothetical protein
MVYANTMPLQVIISSVIRSLISFSCDFTGARDPRDAVDGSCCVAEDEVGEE